MLHIYLSSLTKKIWERGEKKKKPGTKHELLIKAQNEHISGINYLVIYNTLQI